MAASVRMRDSSIVVLCRTSCMRAVSFSRYSRTVSGERSSTLPVSVSMVVSLPPMSSASFSPSVARIWL